jgi:two-component system cell cycle sensor histidine kinase/response regulator CckA
MSHAYLTTPRLSWPLRLGIAVGSMVLAVAVTDAFWSVFRYTPFLLGFTAAVVSGRIGGRHAGLLAVIVGVLGYATFPPASEQGGFGLLVGFVVISTSFSWIVARQYETEAALRSSESRLAEAQQVANVGSWELNVKDNSAWWSDGLYRICGFEPNAFAPTLQSFIDLLPHDEVESVTAHIQRALQDHQPFEVDHRITRADGEVRMVHAWCRVVLDDSGRVAKVVCTAQDISDRKRLEEQLQQAQKMEAVGRLAGGIAHDFNNLLTVIVGCTEFAMEALGPAHSASRDIEQVQRASESAATLTRQLLAFSRRQILLPQVLDLNGVIERTKSFFMRLIGEDIELLTRFTENLSCVSADLGQIEQVIMNLVVNARDAMPNGGRLTIETANVELSSAYVATHPGATCGAHVMLAVSDTGTGMDETVRQHLFEPFYTTKERGKGTGLGLATIYGIVKQSGGFIWVSSEVGRGTTIQVYLPVATSKAQPLLPSEEADLAPGTETILLVEDQEDVRAVGREALRRNGYAVLEAADASAAVEAIRQHSGHIDLLLTDVVMPGLNGRELAELLRRDRPHLRVLYTSGYTDGAILHRGVLDEDVAFLQKPFTRRSLLLKVRQVLEAPASTAVRVN